MQPHNDKTHEQSNSPLLVTARPDYFLEGAATEVLQTQMGVARPDYIEYLMELFKYTIAVEFVRPVHPIDGHIISTSIEAYSVGTQTVLFEDNSVRRAEFLASAGSTILLSEAIGTPFFKDISPATPTSVNVALRKIGPSFYKMASDLINQFDDGRSLFWRELGDGFSIFQCALAQLVRTIKQG